MKQTVKTSRAAGQLEKMFRELNKHYYNGELPEPIISLKKTPSAYGHITVGKVWQAGQESKYEINLSSATLSRPIEETAATLLHEMAHEYNLEHGIKDTSNQGVYHNKNFKATAETHGLHIDHHPKYGWTVTSPTEELLDFIIFQGWQDIQMVERLGWTDFAGTGTPKPTTPKEGGDRVLDKVGQFAPALQAAGVDGLFHCLTVAEDKINTPDRRYSHIIKEHCGSDFAAITLGLTKNYSNIAANIRHKNKAV